MSMRVSKEEPVNKPVNGEIWLDTAHQEMKIWKDGNWYVVDLIAVPRKEISK